MGRFSRVFHHAPLVLALLALGGGASAQTVVGHVTEEGSLKPLEGVFVVLEDEAGVRHNGVLTGDDGRFFLRAPPGRFRLAAELIGHATARTDVLTLEPGSTVQVDMSVPVEAVTLEGIDVEAGARCRARPGAGEATARLWDEARKALEVARWSEQERILRFRAVEFDRDVDVRTGDVLANREKPKSGFSSSSMYQSIPAERLARGGYIQRDPEGGFSYYAPDADVLLSDSFLDTHCFIVRGSPEDEPGLVGLGFQPVPGRTVPEIVGVLWLDRGTAELRRLDFTYRGVPLGEDWKQVGGEVDFARLSTGVWIVSRWALRMPLKLRQVGGYGNSPKGLDLVTVREHGAEVRSARSATGEVLAGVETATLFGDAARADGSPLAGAMVELLGTDFRTRTGADGRYRISGVPAGLYLVRMSHPDVLLAGARPVEQQVTLTAGRARRLAYASPLSPERAQALCRAWGWTSDGAPPVVVYGRVVGPDGSPRPGAVVRLGTADAQQRIVADSAGVYRGCAAASGDPLGARLEGAPGGRTDLGAPPAGFVRVDLTAPGG